MKEKWRLLCAAEDDNGHLPYASYQNDKKRVTAIITDKEIILQTDTKIRRTKRKTSQLNLPPGEVTKKD